MAGPAPLQLKSYPGGALALDVAQARRCFPAFLICGILVSFLGAILPAWGYHLREDFGEVGEYFLSLNLGFLLSVAAGQWLLARKGLKFTLILANVLASGELSVSGILLAARTSELADGRSALVRGQRRTLEYLHVPGNLIAL